VEIRQLRFAMLFLVLLMPVNAEAIAIGMPLPSARLGLAVGVANLTVNDPIAETGNEWVIRPINIIYTDELIASRRYWLEAFYQDAVLSASQHQLGQHVTQLGGRASLQRRVGTASIGESWLGAGLQASYDSYEKRHSVDSAGYLLASYLDRSGGQAALLLNYIFEKNISGRDVAIKLEQSIPLADGVSEFTIAVSLLFDY